MKKKQKENLALGIALLVMVLLFISSSQPYKEQSSISFLQTILAKKPFEDVLRSVQFMYANKVISVQELGYFEFIEFFVRKFAHFSSYFILGVSWIYALRGKMKDKKMAGLVAILLCVSYAAFDEFHQSLTPNRTPLMEDVVLDSAGALVGIFIQTVHHYLKYKKR